MGLLDYMFPCFLEGLFLMLIWLGYRECVEGS